MSTIFALSTVSGKSAVAVVRISGPLSRSILSQLTSPTHRITPRRASLRALRHPKTSDLLDHALTFFFEGPGTFTGEDIVELHLHGSKPVISAVLDAIPSCTHPVTGDSDVTPSAGAVDPIIVPRGPIRVAEPGEFSKRAFYNDKLDLTQAEGLSDLINAETDEQRRSAHRVANGSLSRLYSAWRADLVRLRSKVEAIIDFSEDNEDIAENMQGVVDSAALLRRTVERHLVDSRRGELMRSGIKVVIFGPVNAGKSSLLNLITRREASIVSPEPGTTRDVVETVVDVGGFPVLLGDTAGLRCHDAQVGGVEREGMKRARERVGSADVRVCVVPNGCDLDHVTKSEIEGCREEGGGGRPLILLLNKSDTIDVAKASTKASLSRQTGITEDDIYEISCVTGQNIELFLSGLVDHLRILTLAGSGTEEESQLAVGTNARQRSQVQKCLMHLDAFIGDESRDVVIGAEELRYASDALGRVTGKIDVEEILGKIFSSFCIGK